MKKNEYIIDSTTHILKESMKITKPLFLILFLIFYSLTHAVENDAGNLAVRMDSLLSAFEKEGFCGAVLLDANNRQVLSKGYGTSCGSRNIEPDMVFDLGSITKAITATGILNLASQNKIKLSDSLSKFVKSAPPDKAAITIQQLLTHQSGLEDSFGKDEDWIEREDLITKVMQSKLKFTPGQGQAYSNAGYTLLGYIIETVTKMSYEEYTHKNLFEPLQIENTGYTLPEWKAEEIVCGILDGKKWGSVKDYFGLTGPSWFLMANGGMLSTLSDLHRFFGEIINGEVLDESATGLLTSGLTSRTKKGDCRLLSTSGANYIFSSLYMNWLDDGVILILFTSNSSWPKEKVYPSLLPIIDQFIDKKDENK